MKLSLRWIFDHIQADLKDIDVKYLLDIFDAKSAEIEAVDHIKVDTSRFTLVRITTITEQKITGESPELKKTISLPPRKEVGSEGFYLIKKEGRSYIWATFIDIGSSKEGLMPAVWCPEEDAKGRWKKKFEEEDYILTIDNKALTHRPDLWGHRGIARECAALLEKPLIPEEALLTPKPIKHYAYIAPVSPTNPFTVEILAEKPPCGTFCRRLAGLYIQAVDNTPSILSMAIRLARVDARPLRALVDATNYVMFDIGQPMHAFDANKITTHMIVGRCAKNGESLELLDGDTVKLTDQDYIITDGKKPIALAGIMGGKEAAVSSVTRALFIEAANFDPAGLRRTSSRIKKRTESSARFEKNLDPNQNTQALLRFLKLLEECDLHYSAADALVSIGPLSEEKIIIISQALIDKKIGMHITSDKIERILTSLGFGVKINEDAKPFLYTVTVPTFRATKDVTIAEDIVEEIARFIGYDSIIPHLPTRVMAPFDIKRVQRLRQLKEHLAFGLAMHEVETYAFYDEEFLKLLEYDPQDALRVANPLSEHWQRLVTSLLPNILKCVYTNHTKADTLRFFECNRVWFYDKEPLEQQECAGIFFEHKKPIDFYTGKALLESLFDLFKIPVTWKKPTAQLDPWYNSHQTAEIFYKDRIIGRAGKIAQPFLQRIIEGDAFIFELDAHFLLHTEVSLPVYKPLVKYPEVDLDISVLVALQVPVSKIEEHIKQADARIRSVQLLDFYQKDEWKDQKSVTCRFIVYDEQKTLTKEEIDVIWNAVVKEMQKLGATVR